MNKAAVAAVLQEGGTKGGYYQFAVWGVMVELRDYGFAVEGLGFVVCASIEAEMRTCRPKCPKP